MPSSLLVPALALLLVARGGTRHATGPREDGLSNRVLILAEDARGEVHPLWQSATGFSQSRRAEAFRARSEVGRIVLASRRPRDCDQEQIDCVQACMKSRLPSYLGHIQRADGGKKRFCERECLEKCQDCLDLQKAQALRFQAEDDAVDGLKHHHTELLVGTIVIIAGIAFVTVSAGTGAAILAPLMLVAY
jgi:hypothetical protein